MSNPRKNHGDDEGGGKHPPGSPTSPATKRLRDRVSFFEKVWTGTRSGSLEDTSTLNVDELERKLAEERSKSLEHAQFEHVTLKRTPLK